MGEHGEDTDDVSKVAPEIAGISLVILTFCCLSDQKVYPMDERQWLLATSYNTGLECLQSVLFFSFVIPIYLGYRYPLLSLCSSTFSLDEAKRWFETSTVICRFVPDGESRAEKVESSCLSISFVVTHHRLSKISQTYTSLLARFTRDKTST